MPDALLHKSCILLSMTTMQGYGTIKIYLNIQAFELSQEQKFGHLWALDSVKSHNFEQSVNLSRAHINSSTELLCEQRKRGLFQDGLRTLGLIYFNIKIAVRLNERKRK